MQIRPESLLGPLPDSFDKAKESLEGSRLTFLISRFLSQLKVLYRTALDKF